MARVMYYLARETALPMFLLWRVGAIAPKSATGAVPFWCERGACSERNFPVKNKPPPVRGDDRL
jgi:hypothetical protein